MLNAEIQQHEARIGFETADWLATQEALRFDSTERRRDSSQVLSDLTYLAVNSNETAATLLGEAVKNNPLKSLGSVVVRSAEIEISPELNISEEITTHINSIISSVGDSLSEEEALYAISTIEDRTGRMVGFNLLSQKLERANQ